MKSILPHVWLKKNKTASRENRTKISSWEEMKSSESTVYLSCTKELIQEIVYDKEKDLDNLRRNDVF